MILDNEFKENRPLYQQIMDYVEDCILMEEFKECERVLSIRELSEKMGVNPNTCAKAFEILTENKIIESKRGLGYFVATGAALKVLQKRRDEIRFRLIPLIVLNLKKYKMDKDEFIKSICDLYDDPIFNKKLDLHHPTDTK